MKYRSLLQRSQEAAHSWAGHLATLPKDRSVCKALRWRNEAWWRQLQISGPQSGPRPGCREKQRFLDLFGSHRTWACSRSILWRPRADIVEAE